ncbi:DUF4189 domain-containing protein [Pseudomonas syringae group sp. J309-1]|uniref:DUF4189 domain-containing protein n=1 Tax=Pseudomonas syringae group sp. J309-1 TaxID=3079588 RepID=UPI003977CA34
MLRATLFSLLVLAVSTPAFSQTACPSGVAPGSPQCGPDSGTSRANSAPSRPTGEWIKTWGAIAGSDSRGEAWTSIGRLSKAEAEAEEQALDQCKAAGASDCIVTLAYQNQCVSMASPPGSGRSATNSAKSKEISNQDALAKCQEVNGQACEVIYSACTDPIFKKF